MSNLAARPRQFTGRHMLAIMVAFFGVVIGVNLALAFFANSTWSGLVVANGYVASQKFNADEAEARAQAAKGWSVRAGHGDGRVTVSFADRTAAAIGGLTVAGTLQRPTTDRDDAVLAFSEEAAGSYAAAADLAPGVWDLAITATEAGGAVAYRKTFRFVVK